MNISLPSAVRSDYSGADAKPLEGVSEFDSQSALNEVIELREALYSLIMSAVHRRRPDESHLRTLNKVFSEAPALDEVMWHKRKFVRSFRESRRDRMDPFGRSYIPRWV